MQIRLLKPGKRVVISYEATLLRRDPASATVRAVWTAGVVDLGLLRFEPGDWLDEHFYAARWYNIFALHRPDGQLKGWYCNVTRPAIIADDLIESEDLELDLLVSADRRQLRLDDEAEFLARELEHREPEAYCAALAAVEELRGMVARGEPPFDQATEGTAQ